MQHHRPPMENTVLPDWQSRFVVPEIVPVELIVAEPSRCDTSEGIGGSRSPEAAPAQCAHCGPLRLSSTPAGLSVGAADGRKTATVRRRVPVVRKAQAMSEMDVFWYAPQIVGTSVLDVESGLQCSL